MEGKRFIHELRLRNLLSYGPEAEAIKLEPLNVLIGPNASGKSNLLEAISLLQAAPRDLGAPIREGGGVSEWLWKGADEGMAEIVALVTNPTCPVGLRHSLSFEQVGQRLAIGEEYIAEDGWTPDRGDLLYYRWVRALGVFTTPARRETTGGPTDTEMRDWWQSGVMTPVVTPEQSVLAELRDARYYPEITYLARQYEQIHLYREWNLGRSAVLRRPQPSDLADDFLEEDAVNLGMVLNDLEHRGDPKRMILECLERFYGATERMDLTTKIQGGTVQIFLREPGLKHPIPATRLSDGTLRFLCLLAVLCHPEPPPLICIEEPELGLHPDVMPMLAELLQAAAARTQLIVTTHSDRLLSSLMEVPEAVVVCERDPERGTTLTRLDPEPLKEWLERYTLGTLWAMGEIGGNP